MFDVYAANVANDQHGPVKHLRRVQPMGNHTLLCAGMWYHLSLFLNAGELGVAYTGITTASALSQVVGGPLAAALLLLDGTFGMHGWQWLFLCEGLPTIAFAVILKVRHMCSVL